MLASSLVAAFDASDLRCRKLALLCLGLTSTNPSASSTYLLSGGGGGGAGDGACCTGDDDRCIGESGL